MATDDRPYQARRLRQSTRYTPLTIGIPSLDSRAFQKKGVWVFSWRDAIQKKPQGMDISLRQNRAFLSKIQFEYMRRLVKAALTFNPVGFNPVPRAPSRRTHLRHHLFD